jgi:hypothetical protein
MSASISACRSATRRALRTERSQANLRDDVPQPLGRPGSLGLTTISIGRQVRQHPLRHACRRLSRVPPIQATAPAPAWLRTLGGGRRRYATPGLGRTLRAGRHCAARAATGQILPAAHSRPSAPARPCSDRAGNDLRVRRAAAASGRGDDQVGELLAVAGLDVPLPTGAVGSARPGRGLLGVAALGVVDASRLEVG